VKLVIQIPCFNEAECLPATLRDLPRVVEGFDEVEWLVVDDGSTDGTATVAQVHGVDHVVRLSINQGLARAFMAGLVAAVERGADVIVNTDADNQYNARNIPDLVQPILAGQADIVVGARSIHEVQHFSRVKRALQRFGSGVVRRLTGLEVADAPSGFRAFTRHAACRMNVFTSFTYTVETILQAGLNNLRVVSVPVGMNGPTRPSRLFRSIWSYIGRIIFSMLQVYTIYRPAYLFCPLALVLLAGGIGLGLRYLYLDRAGEGAGHVQSVILCAVLLLSGCFSLAIGVITYLLSINRRLLEDLRWMSLSRSSPLDMGCPRGLVPPAVLTRVPQ
jgi:glycosyltransferase involved in cell wall biosynthesis